MSPLRFWMQRHRVAAMLLVAAALCLKALLPTGCMFAAENRTLTVALCQDASGGEALHRIVIPAKNSHEVPGKPQKGDCPYCALSMASLGAADPVLLVLAIAFLVALGFAPIRIPVLRLAAYLRPPLRGPPLIA